MTNNIKRNIGRLIKYKETVIGSIIIMHRVGDVNQERLWYNEHLKLSTETIEHFVKKAKYNGCSFISLDELHYILTKKKRARRIICMTLDDGYEDNFTKGLPCFKQLNVPFCIYVSTSFLNNEAFLWWYSLEDLILSNNFLVLSDGTKYNCYDKKEKENAFINLRNIVLNLPQDRLLESFKDLFRRYSFDPLKYVREMTMSWQQIEKLINEPLATIGNHTHTHMSFQCCENDEIKKDILKAQELVRLKTGYTMKHFSFPFGGPPSITPTHYKLIKELGFNTATTTYDDSIRYNSDLSSLPRKFITEKNVDLVLSQIVND